MVKITDIAANELKNFLQKNKITDNNVRLYISGLGWGGPQLSLAADQIKDGDTQFKTNDFNFLLDPKIIGAMNSYGNVEIDYQKSPFWGSGYSIKFAYATEC